MNKAIFLDRDGTLIADCHYLADPEQISLLPGAGEALARLQAKGFLLVLASNQSGVGRGMFSRASLEKQHRRLQELLQPYEVELAAIEVCRHTPEDNCDCRKPKPEMLLRAARNLQLDLPRSYMIGDKLSDVEAGASAGCRTVLLGRDDQAATDWQVDSLAQAALCILDNPEVTAVIPARYGSTRFPGKALADISGKPMIQWVYEAVKEARRVEQALVATDDARIADTVRGFGGEAAITSTQHPTGTDRIVEALQGQPGDLILNVQGDEPLLRGRYLDRLIWRVTAKNSDMGTIAVPFDQINDTVDNPNLVKVVVDNCNRAMYFSRAPIPFQRGDGEPVEPLLHWGIYAYRREILEKYVGWPQSRLEKCEMLEQLRALENGVDIQVLIAEQPTIGVDRPEDLKEVERILAERG